MIKKGNMAILTQDFFKRPVLEVAPDLLGKYLVRGFSDGSELALKINEVEAYDGPNDKACHAARGRTARTEVMFGDAGIWYVYLIYGMYHMLNIVTGEEGYPSAVLIRGASIYDGPGKLTKHLDITKRRFNKEISEKKTGLWIERRENERPGEIITTPRIGVGYAGGWAEKEYRFLLKNGN